MWTCHQISWVLGFVRKFLQLLEWRHFLIFFIFCSFGILMISANGAVSHHQLHGIVDCFWTFFFPFSKGSKSMQDGWGESDGPVTGTRHSSWEEEEEGGVWNTAGSQGSSSSHNSTSWGQGGKKTQMKVECLNDSLLLCGLKTVWLIC